MAGLWVRKNGGLQLSGCLKSGGRGSQIVGEYGQRVLRRLFAHLAAAAGKVVLFGPDSLFGGETEPNGADGFVVAAAIGAGNAGNAEREVVFGGNQRAERHFAYGFFADGTVVAQGVGIDVQYLLLGFVGVSDKAAVEKGGAAGQLG